VERRPATVVLVHGAWHGAWCFDQVMPLLHDAGIEAIAVDLPGHGDDDGPLGDHPGDVARVTAALDAIDGDVVLLGHSYGGSVITQAGVHPAVRRLVYLCAFALAEDESTATATAAAGAPGIDAISHEGRPNLGHAMILHDDGTTTLTRDGARECLYADVDDATFEWAFAKLCPQPMSAVLATPTAIAWRTVPSTYVVCTEDMAVHPDLQRLMARRCTDQIEWAIGHSPFASRPELLSELLVDLAHSAPHPRPD
jgi:pimeloyl-ACP methyl ester carboxylesterase